MEAYGSVIRSKGCKLKCLLGTFISFYVLTGLLVVVMLFAKRETVCKEEKVLDPKFVCPSKAVWTFLKWVMVGVICALIVKITVACKLY